MFDNRRGNETTIILQLNNYPYNQQVVDDVLEFKTTGVVPEHIKQKQDLLRNGLLFMSPIII